MFKHLTEFSYQRTAKEAFGFYLAYLVIIILLGMLSGGIAGVAVGPTDNDFDMGVRIGTVFAILASLILTTLVVYKKKLHQNFLYVLLVIVAGGLAILGGGILGLIPAAYLTTKPVEEAASRGALTPPQQPA
ncbi:MAG: hypothetical protein A2676_01185 [Candidatus Sungbacteria bacterium RIFCSPHIGHO2_01_FULL_51_22]|uniref:Uncharacterized protein n=1 Tax=Candidatus Sungbacteria bacterium RIFCSPHIGHO2_02_FULL_51_29 TaxID=1802273 RepID=A0A1G2KZQ4_9BACT|nr:MAG: hypothetical protein A2676_01185 [Candidatus Sungbacteria bacterium RIFCSPHIGHO2_01_FULL_51_22]OHA03992.1 MAG: hypothetical protein A3C16_03050 [Candidatus Sungbacteria bacterium RIFCSPHIGHO2_02_FULL_51_29]OHA07740.1 MAG: hypothetical protein A3B29_04895 [Candidatus Sungbacteria bacterium RIFCSPLOWO2_01_FULL_51_34]